MAEEGDFQVRQVKLTYIKVSSKLYIYIMIKKCVINLYIIYKGSC